MIFPRRIPLFNVHMPPEAHDALREVMYSGQIANGPNVGRFERLLQEYIGNPHITSTGDISSSIALCLYMAGVRPGDEVLASPMACLATNIPVKNLFARVVWCDIGSMTGNIDPADAERQISPRSKAILAYHWAGNPVDLNAINAMARKHGLKVMEDAGEALGAEYRGKKIGATGNDFTIFSFYPNRHITTGEGAAIAFGNAEDFERAQWLKRYGIHQPTFRDEWGEISRTSDIPEAGYNSYLNHLAATIGVTQMSHVSQVVRRHRANGQFYDEALRGINGITLLQRLPETLSAYWVYTFLAERRDDLLRHLRACGIHASKLHLRNDLYSCFEPLERALPGVEHFDRHALSVPCGWWMTEEDCRYVSDHIRTGW
jgi:dTDP-4-amino-4,6-dideoxygalactose transaminase